MVRIENHLGRIDISEEFFINLVGGTVTGCFGVAGMATSSPTQGFKNYLKSIGFIGRRAAPDKGIKIRYSKSKLTIELHIIVTYGTNLSAIVKSISEKVRYVVEEMTGLDVSRVNVFVDGMKNG